MLDHVIKTIYVKAIENIFHWALKVYFEVNLFGIAV